MKMPVKHGVGSSRYYMHRGFTIRPVKVVNWYGTDNLLWYFWAPNRVNTFSIREAFGLGPSLNGLVSHINSILRNKEEIKRFNLEVKK